MPSVTSDKQKKYIAKEAVEKVYAMFRGTTWYLQKVMNELWRTTDSGQTYLIEDVEPAIEHIIRSNTETYQDILYQLTTRQKELLLAIWREGQVQQITRSAFIKRYRLSSASSVQKAAETLVRQHIITQDKGVFEIYDKFFALWLATMERWLMFISFFEVCQHHFAPYIYKM